MKRCTNPDCSVPAAEQTFYPGQWRCVVCSKAHATDWIKANRERWNAQRRRRRLELRLEKLGFRHD